MTTRRFRLISRLKWVLLMPEVVVLIVVGKMVNLQAWIQAALGWIDGLGATGAIAFIVIYSIATVLFIPGSFLTLGGGALFGVVFGSVYVFAGAAMGATVSFLMGRYLARTWVTERIQGNVRFEAVDRAIAQEGFKIVLLTRLSPVFPFTLLNYALGITQVSLKDYLLGFLGMIPGTVLYVYIGSLAGNLATLGSGQNPETERMQWIVRGVGLVATVAVTLYVTRIAQKALTQSVSAEGEHHGA